MEQHTDSSDRTLRRALEENGHRFTEQRAAVFRFLADSKSHPTAEEVFLGVRPQLSGISLATVYKSLETLVGCGLAAKLGYGDGCARYDARTDPHPHVRCLSCGRIEDLPRTPPKGELAALRRSAQNFEVTGYRVELLGFCPACQKEPLGQQREGGVS